MTHTDEQVAVKRHKQLLKHDPDNGIHGDCYRTCIAMLAGLDPAQVPHFCDGQDDDGSARSRAWLKERGIGLTQWVFSGDQSIKHLLQSTAHHSPGVPMILTFMGARGVNHCAVILDGEIFCDPHTGLAGVLSDVKGPAESPGEAWWWIEVLAPLSAMPAPDAQAIRNPHAYKVGRTTGRIAALQEAAAIAKARWRNWGRSDPHGAVECDVTACENIAAAILALIDHPAPAPVSVAEAAKVLLDAWRCSQTIDADEKAQDYADIHECDVDAGRILEPWLRALAKGDTDD